MRKYLYPVVFISIFIVGACSKPGNAPVEVNEKTESQAQNPVAVVADDPLKRGRILYTRCKSCHTLEEGGKHRVGPNLWNIGGASAGKKEGFAYSTVMSESEVIWTDEALAAYIENPKKFMPGNRMSFAGLRKPEDQAAVIEYLKAKTTPQ